MDASVHREAGIEWSVVSRSLPGETVSGDQHLVARSAEGLLMAVIDGLGHGDEATAAARAATDVLARHANEPVVRLIQLCHAALKGTRGAAMTLLAINARQRTAMAVGVGNVETVVVRRDRGPRQPTPPRETVLLRNGVVGYQLPPLQPSEIALEPGDVVVFATDGVREDFGERVTTTEPLPQLVQSILRQKFRGTDDALVLACKILEDYES